MKEEIVAEPVAEEKKPEPEAPAAPVAAGSRCSRRAGSRRGDPGESERLTGPNVVGKIQLPVNEPKRNQPVASSSNTNSGTAADHKRKRKRKDSQRGGNNQPQGGSNRLKEMLTLTARISGTGITRMAGGGANRPDFRRPERHQTP